jgi:ABC-type multidrug transport system fused ATPase/permease subunit
MFGNGAAFIQQGAAYGYLIYSVVNGRLGIGSFTMYLAAINAFLGSMNMLMNNIIDIRRYSDYYGAVDEFMNSRSVSGRASARWNWKSRLC